MSKRVKHLTLIYSVEESFRVSLLCLDHQMNNVVDNETRNADYVDYHVCTSASSAVQHYRRHNSNRCALSQLIPGYKHNRLNLATVRDSRCDVFG